MHGRITDDICVMSVTGVCDNKENTTPNAELMLGHRRRLWANVNTALGERLLFAVNSRLVFACHVFTSVSLCQEHPSSTTILIK